MSENRHPAMRLRAPDGEWADIDARLVPLIKALWADGYDTIGCCQDIGESAGEVSDRWATHWGGYAQVELLVPDACRLLDVVKNTPQFKDRMHWAEPGAWSVTIPVLPFGWDDDAQVMPWAQVRFPAEQISDLVDAIRHSTS